MYISPSAKLVLPISKFVYTYSSWNVRLMEAGISWLRTECSADVLEDGNGYSVSKVGGEVLTS